MSGKANVRQYLAGRYAAQEARRAGQARADDHDYAHKQGTRFQSGAAVVNTDTREEGVQYGQGVAAGGSLETPRELPKSDDRPHKSAGAGGGAMASPPPRPRPKYTNAQRPDPRHPLVALCRFGGLPEPVPEFRFHPTRKWRADYAWPSTDPRVIVEIDGGVWSEGRHTRGAGFIEDQKKLNAAALLGFLVLRYTPDRLQECIADLSAIFTRQPAR